MGYSLDLLKQIAHGLAQQFGDSCEIVIHDVRHGIENTILYIENGHVTDRKSGDSASVVVKHFCNTLFENSPGISSFKWCFPIIVGMRTDMIVPYVHISV